MSRPPRHCRRIQDACAPGVVRPTFAVDSDGLSDGERFDLATHTLGTHTAGETGSGGN